MASSLYSVRKKRSLGNLLDRKMAAHVVARGREYNAARRQRMAIFANDEIGVYINQFGFYEKEQLEILFEFLAPLRPVFESGVAFDVGANIGNHAIYFSSLFRTVHAFEPNPHTFTLLSFNAQWAGNVVVHNYGLGDEKGRFPLGESADNVGRSSIKYASHGDATVEISVERLDGASLDSSGLCFVKMDVEGFEPNVVRGGAGLIKARQPLIVFEQHEHEFVDGQSETVSLLAQQGYRFAWHQNGSASKNALVRRLHNIKDIFFGRVHRIVSASAVPPNTYPMLLAIPPRFQKQLGLE
jgi:FkbM family methyltransferase